jgi:ribosome maturation factor RimP
MADEKIDISLKIPNENQQTYEGKIVLISGVWHYLNVTIANDPEEIKIVFYKGNSTPTEISTIFPS